MLERAAAGELTILHLIGVDPARDFEDPHLARRALERVDTLIVQDLLPTASISHAHVVLPACAPQERVGSFTTWEGRRQSFPQAVPPQGLAFPDWDILRQLARVLGTDLGWETAADVRREAAPLMERAETASPFVVRTPFTSDANVLASAPDGDYPLTVVSLDHLIGRGDMLRGAKELLATARPVVVQVSQADAQRLQLRDEQHVAVVGPSGRMTLPVSISSEVVEGCVVLPRNSTDVTPGELGGGRVRLEPVGSEG
jgi:NADH-quinone oxidoreductase subunit G